MKPDEMPWPQPPAAVDVFVDMKIDLEPVSKGRPRATTSPGGKVRTYTPKRSREYEQEVGWILKAAHLQRNEMDDLGVQVIFHLKGRRRSDVDNLCKALLDSCNGIVWRDDQQVVRLTADIIHGSENPHTRFKVYIVNRRTQNCSKCSKLLTLRQISNGQLYCGKACFDGEQRHLRMKRSCSVCGKTVERSPSKSESYMVFCSPECRTSRRGNCRVCGKQVSTAPTARRPFCSDECSVRWYRQNPLKVKARGVCPDCGGPSSRAGVRCRACFVVKRSAEAKAKRS